MSKKFSVIVADPPWGFKDSLKMSNVKRGAKANYSTMTMQQIKAMAVEQACDPAGAVLCLWVPGSLLQEGLDTMKAWGFKHKQTYVWVKIKKDPLKNVREVFFNFWRNSVQPLAKFNNSTFNKAVKSSNAILDTFTKGAQFVQDTLAFGMGHLFRQTHEICLIGTRGKINSQLANKSQRSVSFASNLKHSAKPEDLQDSLEIMFPTAQKLELFARRIRPGWTCLGNEVCNGEDINVSLSKLT